jgi:hypothetical protein
MTNADKKKAFYERFPDGELLVFYESEVMLDGHFTVAELQYIIELMRL